MPGYVTVAPWADPFGDAKIAPTDGQFAFIAVVTVIEMLRSIG
jgi:hypothetical protein